MVRNTDVMCENCGNAPPGSRTVRATKRNVDATISAEFVWINRRVRWFSDRPVQWVHRYCRMLL